MQGGEIPARSIQRPGAGTGSSPLSAAWVRAMAGGRHPANPAMAVLGALWAASDLGGLRTAQPMQWHSRGASACAGRRGGA